MSHMSEVERLDILRFYQSGERILAIAHRFGVTERTVNRIIERAGMTGKTQKKWSRKKKVDNPIDVLVPMAGPPLPPASIYQRTAAEVKRLKEKGLGTTAIAALLRMPYRDVAAIA
jgi:transposase